MALSIQFIEYFTFAICQTKNSVYLIFYDISPIHYNKNIHVSSSLNILVNRKFPYYHLSFSPSFHICSHFSMHYTLVYFAWEMCIKSILLTTCRFYLAPCAPMETFNCFRPLDTSNIWQAKLWTRYIVLILNVRRRSTWWWWRRRQENTHILS